MRKIYYTKELLAAKLLYPFRRQWVRLILTVLLILGPSAFLLSEWRGLSAWVSTPVIFAIVWGLMYWGFRRNVDKLFDEARYGEVRSFDMMMDDEKIVTDENGVQCTVVLTDIVEVAEFRGYILADNGKGLTFSSPKDQLLDNELEVLENLKSSLPKYRPVTNIK
ncbi:MAG: hypothetical protein QGH94_07030 [Phycisphaerae bacterium]|nr:hypothetical protein [Phycisphaerae bacterium]